MRISSVLIGLAAAIVMAIFMIAFPPQPSVGVSLYWFGVTGTLVIEIVSGLSLYMISLIVDTIADDAEEEYQFAKKRAQAELEFAIAEAVKKALAK